MQANILDSDDSIIEVDKPPPEVPLLICIEDVETDEHITLNVTNSLPPTPPPAAEPEIQILSTPKTTRSALDMSLDSVSPYHWTDEMKYFYNEDWGNEETFDVTRLQAAMKKGHGSWDTGRVAVFGRRARKRPACFNCGHYGHNERDCRPDCCYMCGGKEHEIKFCPFRKCLSCGKKTKSFVERCQVCLKRRKVRCPRCKMLGHYIADCTEHWRRFHHVTTFMKVERPSYEVNKSAGDMWCCNCGRKGHLDSICNRPRDGNSSMGSTLVSSYARSFVMDRADDNQEGSNALEVCDVDESLVLAPAGSSHSQVPGDVTREDGHSQVPRNASGGSSHNYIPVYSRASSSRDSKNDQTSTPRAPWRNQRRYFEMATEEAPQSPQGLDESIVIVSEHISKRTKGNDGQVLVHGIATLPLDGRTEKQKRRRENRRMKKAATAALLGARTSIPSRPGPSEPCSSRTEPCVPSNAALPFDRRTKSQKRNDSRRMRNPASIPSIPGPLEPFPSRTELALPLNPAATSAVPEITKPAAPQLVILPPQASSSPSRKKKSPLKKQKKPPPPNNLQNVQNNQNLQSTPGKRKAVKSPRSANQYIPDYRRRPNNQFDRGGAWGNNGRGHQWQVNWDTNYRSQNYQDRYFPRNVQETFQMNVQGAFQRNVQGTFPTRFENPGNLRMNGPQGGPRPLAGPGMNYIAQWNQYLMGIKSRR